MSKHRKKKLPPPVERSGTRRIRFVVLSVLAGAAAVGSIAYVWAHVGAHVWPRQPPEIPELHLGSMEPRVGEKVSQHVAAVHEDPESHEAWGRLGTVLQAHGLEGEALPCYEKAISLEPSEFRWQYLLVHVLRSRDPERALQQTESALKVDPNYPPLHVIRAELLEQNNDLEKALLHYEKALELEPASSMAATGAGRIYLSRGELERSRELLERAAELDPDASAIHASLAQVYRRLGDRERAAEEARLAFERKSVPRVIDPIHFQMRQESVSSLAQLDRAQGAFEAGDYRRAEGIYRDLVALRPDDADMQARFGDTLLQLDKKTEAKERYLRALEINPDQAAAYYGLANLLNMEGLHDEAEKHYRRSLELRPDHVATMLNLGALVLFQGDREDAERWFRRGLELEPDDFGCHRQLGELLLRTERPEEAIEHFEAALQARPDFGPVHQSLAMALAASGRFEEAWKHAREAERLGAPLPAPIAEALAQRGPSR